MRAKAIRTAMSTLTAKPTYQIILSLSSPGKFILISTVSSHEAINGSVAVTVNCNGGSGIGGWPWNDLFNEENESQSSVIGLLSLNVSTS